MKKTSIIVIITVLVLVATLLISYRLLVPTIEDQKAALEKEEIIIISKDKEILISLEDLLDYGQEFEAILDTSKTKASYHTYMGVELKDILALMNIDIGEKQAVILSGADGYSVAYSTDEILEDKNVYIAYMEDGNYISYQSIITSDLFSNRRCKWLTKIEVR